MAAGITCIKCLGRIDEKAFELKRRLHKTAAKLDAEEGKPIRPFTPPKICSECFTSVLLNFSIEDDPKSDEKEPK
jgi:hypothetical protein